MTTQATRRHDGGTILAEYIAVALGMRTRFAAIRLTGQHEVTTLAIVDPHFEISFVCVN